MSTIQCTLDAQLRCSATNPDTGAQLYTDAAPDEGGRGEHHMPTDLVAAALGCCILSVLGVVAQRYEVDLRGARVDVEKEMAGPPRRRIGKLHARVTLPAGLDAKIRSKLEAAARVCPVHHSFTGDMEQEVTFEPDG